LVRIMPLEGRHSRHARIAAMQPLAEAFGKIARIPILQRRSRHYTNRKIFAYKRHRTQPGVEIASKDCTRDSAKLLWGAFQSGGYSERKQMNR